MTKTINLFGYVGLAVLLTFLLSGTAQAASIISEAQAVDIADEAYTGNGSMTEVELENEDGITVYEVEFTENNGNEVDVVIDAETGDVIAVESDEDEDEEEDEDEQEEDEESEDEEELEDAEQAVLKSQAKVSQDEAYDIALRAYSGSGEFNEMDLDDEDGVLRWEVEFVERDGNEVEVHVDATTGVVIGTKDDVENDDDDDDINYSDIDSVRQYLLELLRELIAELLSRR